MRRWLVGRPRSVEDPGVFHHVSLVAFLAWVGLGADGLSSSSYGPEESFKALGSHVALAPFLALATALTVVIIAAAYSRIIEHFPFGGGGYVVATRLLGPAAGVVSGSALMVDYVLTITTSVASGADAIFSFVPPAMHGWKLPVEFLAIAVLVVLNLRGVRESVTVLAPIFLVFLVTHVVLIGGALVSRVDEARAVTEQVRGGLSLGSGDARDGRDARPVPARLLDGRGHLHRHRGGVQRPADHARAEGGDGPAHDGADGDLAGPHRGRHHPRYLLLHVSPVSGQTMNAVLADRFAGGFHLGGLPLGRWFVWLTLASEALLLFVAAQAGFLDGPRVMANMAVDSWAPHRFAQLSDRLTMQNGVLLMGGSSLVALLYTHGDITTLVTLYAINVFVTFSPQPAGDVPLLVARARRTGRTGGARARSTSWAWCSASASSWSTSSRSSARERWVTLVVTGAVVAVLRLDAEPLPQGAGEPPPARRHPHRDAEVAGSGPAAGPEGKPTAVLLVGGYAGLGVHSLLTIQRLFPSYFQNFVFLSVGVIDSATFKDIAEVVEVKERTRKALDAVRGARAGPRARGRPSRMALGTEAVETATQLCREVAKEFPRALFFAGKLVFEQERWYQRVLHNETAYQIQRRLQFAGLNAMVLPVRLLESEAEAKAA